MFPYVVNQLKKTRKRQPSKSKGSAMDCLIEQEIKSILKIWKGDVTESVLLLDKVIPKIPKYKRGGIGGTLYNQSSFILPMIRDAEFVGSHKPPVKELTLENMLQDLLIDGYHMVFEEINHLIIIDMKKRKEYEKVYGALKTKPLHEQLDTIQFIAQFLKDAETAKNNDDFKLLFNCHLNLAKTFAQRENALAVRFFDLCLNIASEYPCDTDGSSLALSNLHLGLYAKSNDNLEAAYNYLKFVHEFTHNRSPLPPMEDGTTIFYQATYNLSEVCISIGKSKLALNLLRESEDYFRKAYKLAIENGNNSLIVESMLHLGNFFAVKGDFNQSLEILKNCLNLCEVIADWKGVATVCQSIGAVYFKLDDLDKAKEYYGRFVGVSDEDEHVLTESYLQTGFAFNNAGHYNVAKEYVKKALNAVFQNKEMSEYETKARGLYGIVHAHSIYSTYLEYVNRRSNYALETLLNWKEFRINNFKETIARPKNYEGVSNRREVLLKKKIKQYDEIKESSTTLPVYLSHIQPYELRSSFINSMRSDDQEDMLDTTLLSINSFIKHIPIPLNTQITVQQSDVPVLALQVNKNTTQSKSLIELIQAQMNAGGPIKNDERDE